MKKLKQMESDIGLIKDGNLNSSLFNKFYELYKLVAGT
jgi:hypothetical protein